jgi:cytochrome c556
MSKALRLGAGAVAIAAVLGMAVVAVAQNAPADIAKRQEAMKAQGAAAAKVSKMMKGEEPWDQAAAHQAAVTFNNTSKLIPGLFPKGTGPEAGVKTAALPAIWEKKADFDAKAKALEEASAKLASAGDEASFKAEFPNVGKTCGGCHQDYRAKQQ